MGWTTTPDLDETLTEYIDRFGVTKVERAMKRECSQVGPYQWSIAGSPALNDAYPSYEVTYNPQMKRYVCTCQEHAYGQYRKFCTHIIRAIIARRENPNWVDPEPPKPQPAPESVPPIAAGEVNRGNGGALKPPPLRLAVPPAAPSTPLIPPPRILENGAAWTEVYEQTLEEYPRPGWMDEFRPGQWEASVEILDHFKAGKEVVFLSAPTGTGKTAVADTVLRCLGGGLYSCMTKTLQDQVEKDFPYADVLKGRANYLPADVERQASNPHIVKVKDLTCADCTKELTSQRCEGCPDAASYAWGSVDEEPADWHCAFCHPVQACSYTKAKMAALRSKMGVVNLAYLLAEANGPGMTSEQQVVVIDEGDELEEALMRYIEVTVPAKWRKKLKISNPDRKTVADAWVEWVGDEALPKVKKGLARLARDAKSDIIAARELKRLQKVHDDLRRVARTDDRESPLVNGWVYTGYERQDTDDFNVTFKTIKVRGDADRVLWRHAEKKLIMSATLVSPQQMAEDLGLDRNQWAVVEMPSTFPKERRPILVEPVGYMRWEKEHRGIDPKTLNAMADAVIERIERHANQRILVHTVSYKLNRFLVDQVKRRTGRPVATYDEAKDRDRSLTLLEQWPNTVLFAPSFERGVDLKGELCEVTIVPKIPYPNTSDKMISARMYTTGGRGWYAVQTIRKLCQMTGRGMRSADDRNVTYILDSAFLKLYREWKHILPPWWAEALVMSPNDPSWAGKLDWVKEMT